MENKPQNMKFDFEIQIRAWVMGAAITWIANKIFKGAMDDQTSAIVGAFVGAAYDFVAFNIKTSLVQRKTE